MQQRLAEYGTDSNGLEKDRQESNERSRRENLTSDIGSAVCLLKANIGVGALALPLAVKNAGYTVGPIGIIIIGFIASHCMAILVESSRKLCKWNGVLGLNYSETMQVTLKERGASPKVAKMGKFIVNIFLIITQLGFCSIYFLFFGDTFSQILHEAFSFDMPSKAVITIFIPLVILLSWIRNLNHLSPLNILANLSILIGLIIILYDAVYKFSTQEAAVMVGGLDNIGNFFTISLFFGSSIFAFEAIGIILPLENKMRNPAHAKPIILVCMSIIVLSYALFGLIGYLVYGKDIQASITLNLCPRGIPTAILFSIIKILLIFSLLISYCIQFYVPMDFMEPPVQKAFERWTEKLPTSCIRYQNMIEKILLLCFRTTVVILTALLAITVPNLGDLITLIGALASSALALIFPPLIHLLTFWKEREKEEDEEEESDEKKCLSRTCRHLSASKDIAIITFGVIGFAFGTFASLNSIINDFAHVPNYYTCPSQNDVFY